MRELNENVFAFVDCPVEGYELACENRKEAIAQAHKLLETWHRAYPDVVKASVTLFVPREDGSNLEMEYEIGLGGKTESLGSFE